MKETGTNKSTTSVFMVIAKSITGPVDPATTLHAIVTNATQLRCRRATRIVDAAFCAEGNSDLLHCLDWHRKQSDRAQNAFYLDSQLDLKESASSTSSSLKII